LGFLKKHKDRVHTYHPNTKRLMIHLVEYRAASRTSAPQVTREDVETIVQGAIDQETTKGGIRQTTTRNGQPLPDSIDVLDLSRPISDKLRGEGIAVLDDLDALSEGQLRVIDGITDGMIAKITTKSALRNDR
jgi:hypothetical protein